MSLLNSKRLRDYPRLMLISTWVILALNIILHQGWMGAFGQVIAGDYIVFYSTGLIYRSNPALIYDYDTQVRIQQSLVSPTILPGFNPFINPPFVAPIISTLTHLPLLTSLILWTCLALLSVVLSVYLLRKLIPPGINIHELAFAQLVIVILSFFPFIEGFQAGQNHWLTLLLVTTIVVSMLKDQWYLAGFFAGLLIYKPQFVLGLIILWLVWKKFKALLAFAVVVLIWTCSFAIQNGFDLYRSYLHLSQVFMSLPYIAGFPNYLLVTVYGLLTSIFPPETQSVLSIVSQVFLLLGGAGVAWLAYRSRKGSLIEKIPAIMAAMILPLFATPYALLHDLVILVPLYVLGTIYFNSQKFQSISMSVYLGAFFLTFLSALTKFAWVSLLVIGTVVVMVIWLLPKQKTLDGMEIR